VGQRAEYPDKRNGDHRTAESRLDGEASNAVAGQAELGRGLAAARQAAGLTQTELAARLGTTQSAVARLERGSVSPTVETLRRLADSLGVTFQVTPRAGLTIRSSRRGKVKGSGAVGASGGAARAPSRRGLSLEQLRARREELLEIAARRGARNVRVFGSVARGEAGPGSDVDFLVDLEPGRTLFDLSELILDLETALRRKVDVIEIGNQAPTTVTERIQREAVPL